MMREHVLQEVKKGCNIAFSLSILDVLSLSSSKMERKISMTNATSLYIYVYILNSSKFKQS